MTMYGTKTPTIDASSPLSVVKNTAMPAQQTQANLVSPDTETRAQARAQTSHSAWILIIVFGGLYVLLSWLEHKQSLKESASRSAVEKYALRMADVLVMVIFGINLLKIIVAKLILWTKNMPMVQNWLHWFGNVVGNA